MILAYNLSPTLKDLIIKIDKTRTELLLLPLSPKVELRLRWEAQVAKVYWSLVLSANRLSKNQMAKILNSDTKLKHSKEELEVGNYKKGLNYISQEWTGNGRQATLNTLSTLFNIVCKPTVTRTQSISSKNKRELNVIFEYLHSSPEHPAIQAGISQASLIDLAPFEEGNGRMARLLPYLYLYKQGFDCRGMLALDEFYRRDLIGLNMAIKSLKNNKSLTLWLEFFVKGLYIQLLKAFEAARESKFSMDISSALTKLNNRQKEILTILDVPGSKITNKVVQNTFKVSQITASRDLTKLHNLNLIFVHGKGRSTYYTRV